MNSKIRFSLALAVLFAVLIMLPSPLNAQHVVTRKTTTKPKTEGKPAPKKNYNRASSSAKSSSQPRENFGSYSTNPVSDITIHVNGVSFVMKGIQGGTFTMGATAEQEADAESDESPAHRVAISSFHLGQTEVTQALWQAVMGSNPSDFKGDNHPVESVSLADCQKFIIKLNALTGKHFRLPTEAEWEYAARGGRKSHGYRFAGSNNIYEVAWYDMSAETTTHDVATLSPNELGLYDMSGNVSEWCQDYYGKYPSSPQTNPLGASYAKTCIMRGGHWNSKAKNCRVSYRGAQGPGNTNISLGFRLAM